LGTGAFLHLFLFRLKDCNLWIQMSSEGGDSFGEGLRVINGMEVASHAENTPQMVVRSMREFNVLWTAANVSTCNSEPKCLIRSITRTSRFPASAPCFLAQARSGARG
jgi:hypothetical protein